MSDDLSPKPRRRLKNLHVDRVDLVQAGANPGAFVLVVKQETPDTLEGIMADGTVETPEVLKSEENVAQEEAVAKAEFEALRKQLEDVNKELEDARKAREADAERIAKMERERKQGEFVAKAKDLGNIGQADALGNLLLDIAEAVPEGTYKQLEQLLKSANAQLEKGALFATFGQGGADPVVEKTFDERVTEMAKALVDAGKAATLPIAKLQVLNENPDLRAEYRNAR